MEVEGGGGYGACSYPPTMPSMAECAAVTWRPRCIQVLLGRPSRPQKQYQRLKKESVVHCPLRESVDDVSYYKEDIKSLRLDGGFCIDF